MNVGRGSAVCAHVSMLETRDAHPKTCWDPWSCPMPQEREHDGAISRATGGCNDGGGARGEDRGGEGAKHESQVVLDNLKSECYEKRHKMDIQRRFVDRQ